MAEFVSYADNLQQQAAAISPHVSEDWVRLKLESAAHDPEIRLAWDTRNINPADASRDLAYVQHTLSQLQADPNADRGQIQQLQTLSYQLSIAAQSHSILRRLNNSILRQARSLKPPIDAEATADRDAIVQAIRDGQGPAHIPDPPVNFGRMTDKEFKEYTRIHYGF